MRARMVRSLATVLALVAALLLAACTTVRGSGGIISEERAGLLAISPATADRILSPIRRDPALRGISTTRAGSLLKHQIPVRTFADWDDAQPGFFEIDLVAHCGGNAEGAFLSTLVLTDVATG